MGKSEMGINQFDALLNLSDRFYCAWQALLHGDEEMCDHYHKIACEMSEIWAALVDIITDDRERQEYVREEMDKFTQGFAYVPREKRNGTS